MLTKLTQPVVIALIALAGIAVGCATFLIANGNSVPPELWALAFATITGATGIAVPTSAPLTPTPTPTPTASTSTTTSTPVASPPAVIAPPAA